MKKNVTLLTGNQWQALYINNIKVIEGTELSADNIFKTLENETDFEINFVKLDLSENDFTYILNLIYDNGLQVDAIIPNVNFDIPVNSTITLPKEILEPAEETYTGPKIGDVVYIAGTVGALCTVTPGKATVESVQVVTNHKTNTVVSNMTDDDFDDDDDDSNGDYILDETETETEIDYTNVSIYLTFKNIPDYIEKWDILEPIQDRLKTQLGDVTAMYII